MFHESNLFVRFLHSVIRQSRHHNGTSAMKSMLRSTKFIVANVITLMFLFSTIFIYVRQTKKPQERQEEPMLPSNMLVVPNIVHFIRYGSAPVTFIEAVCMLAALKHQKPVRMYVHTDQDNFVGGKYWNAVISHQLGRGFVKLKHIRFEDPDLGDTKPLRDPLIVKLNIMMRYGGIYLDNDCYIAKSLDKHRRYKLTLGWTFRRMVSDSVIMATKDAEFLPIWKDLRTKARSNWLLDWNNAYEVLKRRPSLVHWMTDWLGESRQVFDQIYYSSSESWTWKSVIKLFVGKPHSISSKHFPHAYPSVLNETNIVKFNSSLNRMVKVYPMLENTTSERRILKRHSKNVYEGDDYGGVIKF